MQSSKKIHTYIPKWVALLYTTLAIVTVPWTMYLAIELPENHLSPHWDAAWVGFDIGLLFILLLTGWLAYIKSHLLSLTAAVTATMLVVDAWFDVITAHSGAQLTQSLILALFVEIPLAVLTFRIALKVLNTESHN